MAQHHGWFARREDLRARAFEEIERRARRVRRDLQRPAEVLARVAQADFAAVMAEHVLIERRDEFALAREARSRLAPAGGEKARERAGKPRPALGPTADHHGIGARERE